MQPIHTIPEHDYRPHEESPDCWCRPVESVPGSHYIHNSMDRREEYEQGRKPS